MSDGSKPEQSTPHHLYTKSSTAPANEIFCRRCGVVGEYHQTPGKGPHYAALTCTACGDRIKWLPKPKPPLKPTEKQIWDLRLLGYEGAIPETRREASQQIAELVKAEEGRYV